MPWQKNDYDEKTNNTQSEQRKMKTEKHEFNKNPG